VQLWHVPQELVPQQCPSTQLPLAQSPATLQVWPETFLQAPVASQLFVPQAGGFEPPKSFSAGDSGS